MRCLQSLTLSLQANLIIAPKRREKMRNPKNYISIFSIRKRAILTNLFYWNFLLFIKTTVLTAQPFVFPYNCKILAGIYFQKNTPQDRLPSKMLWNRCPVCTGSTTALSAWVQKRPDGSYISCHLVNPTHILFFCMEIVSHAKTMESKNHSWL